MSPPIKLLLPSPAHRVAAIPAACSLGHPEPAPLLPVPVPVAAAPAAAPAPAPAPAPRLPPTPPSPVSPTPAASATATPALAPTTAVTAVAAAAQPLPSPLLPPAIGGSTSTAAPSDGAGDGVGAGVGHATALDLAMQPLLTPPASRKRSRKSSDVDGDEAVVASALTLPSVMAVGDTVVVGGLDPLPEAVAVVAAAASTARTHWERRTQLDRPWCRYCGAITESGSWRRGPWGPRTLCSKHGRAYQSTNPRKQRQLNLDEYVGEQDRFRPAIQENCCMCLGDDKDCAERGDMVRCSGCPLAYHHSCYPKTMPKTSDSGEWFCMEKCQIYATHGLDLISSHTRRRRRTTSSTASSPDMDDTPPGSRAASSTDPARGRAPTSASAASSSAAAAAPDASPRAPPPTCKIKRIRAVFSKSAIDAARVSAPPASTPPRKRRSSKSTSRPSKLSWVDSNARPYKCSVANCGMTFKLPHHLRRHRDCKHPDDGPFEDIAVIPYAHHAELDPRRRDGQQSDAQLLGRFVCQYAGCNKRFKSHWGRSEHHRRVHNADGDALSDSSNSSGCVSSPAGRRRSSNGSNSGRCSAPATPIRLRHSSGSVCEDFVMEFPTSQTVTVLESAAVICPSFRVVDLSKYLSSTPGPATPEDTSDEAFAKRHAAGEATEKQRNTVLETQVFTGRRRSSQASNGRSSPLANTTSAAQPPPPAAPPST